MKNTLKILFMASVLLTSPLTLAASWTPFKGSNLLEYCQTAIDLLDNNFGRVQMQNEYIEGTKTGICQGYLMSINEMQLSLSQKATYCLPNNYNMLRGAATIVKFLKDHPEQQQLPANRVVLNAFQTYFPCRG
jgi:hypothetical protein